MDKILKSLDNIADELTKYATAFELTGNHNFGIDLGKLANKIRYNGKLLFDERTEYDNDRQKDIQMANNNMMNALMSGIEFQKLNSSGEKKRECRSVG